MIRLIATVVLALGLAGCFDDETVVKPRPVALNDEALGHYCQMNILEHAGPKAQVHLVGSAHPLWFSQVRDAIAFLRMPEETAEVAAVYVNDMARAASWADPGTTNWIDADGAFFVVNSRRAGGMGAPEAVPFARESDAQGFAGQHGGQVVRLGEIGADYVLSPVDVSAARAGAAHHTE